MLFQPLLSLLACASSLVVANPVARSSGVLVKLRVEGLNATIYEGPIYTTGHNVTTESGGNHHCDGTNLGANPSSGPTATSALDSAAKLFHFTFDGTYSTSFDDFFITRIGSSAQTDSQFWGLLIDYQFTDVGGCQQRVAKGDEILWAFDAFSRTYFLKTSGPNLAKVGVPITVKVVDGSTGVVIAGASIGGVTTSAEGTASITFNKVGVYKLKAERSDAIRSNALIVAVTP